MRTHEAALATGVALHGVATVNFVIPALDSGAIGAQAAVPVREGDTPETLASRVFEAESVLYPCAVRWFVEGQLRLAVGRAVLADGTCRWLVAGDNNKQGRSV
ncbi:MAG: Phosphoribosylglycinamide formyltransferase [Burkholderia gladioli]|nr:MAG: Phosphoribosylglycinamide formyltransferase [Burkholderia gladioli]